jgi:hypothetical protein
VRQGETAQNVLHYAVGILQRVIVPDADDAKTLGFEPTGALPFVGCHYGMLATVDFNDQLLLEADEVDDVRS